MAVGGVEVIDLGFQALEAITKFRFVTGNLASVRGAEMADAAGERVMGVAQHDVSAEHAADEAAVNVRVMGISTVEAGAVVAAGADVMTDASGRAITAVATNRVVGVALDGAGAAGELITVVLAGPASQIVA